MLFSSRPLSKNPFNNKLTVSTELNPYTYRSFYNGGGVAIGDINNDGLPDVYFAGNQVGNALFLNKGNLNFVNITKSAGVECQNDWSTGVTMVDINSDGWLDIYVCIAGKPNENNNPNRLYINNRDNTFTEQAKKYGLDIKGLSVHSCFFDYDHDGDLDAYVLNNSSKSVGVGFDLKKDMRLGRDNEGNKLLRNDYGVF